MSTAKSSINIEVEQPNRFFKSRTGPVEWTKTQTKAIDEEQKEVAEALPPSSPPVADDIKDYFNK